MKAGIRTAVVAALRPAALAAAVLALLAGILGMHVLTAGHSAHATPASTAAKHAGHAGAAHDGDAHPRAGDHAVGHSHDGHTGQGAQPAAGSFTASGSCSSGCPGAEEAGAACVPLVPAGSPAVAPPPATSAAPLYLAAGARSTAYNYIPSGPTPCELSISRT